MADFVEVARIQDIPDGGGKQVSVHGDLVGLFRCGERVFAVNDVCTHEEAYLTEGEFDCDDLEAECPRHGSRFDVTDGSVRILPATKPAKTYEVKIDGDIVLVSSQPASLKE